MAIKYKLVASKLREQILSKKFSEDKLPTEAVLMKKYQVSRQTVRDALALLETEGLIERIQGSGTFLTGRSPKESENWIATFLPSTQEYIYPRLYDELKNQFHTYGFSLKPYTTYNNPALEREHLLELIQNSPKGLLAMGCKSALPNPNIDLYLRLEELGCPIVFLFNHYTPSHFPCLVDNNVQGSHLLVRHLVEQGHKAIGGIFQADDLQGLERYQGFMEGMRDAGLPLPSASIAWYRTEDVIDILNSKSNPFLENLILKKWKNCTAIICHNDLIAHHVILILRKNGYRIPEDICVASFDNTYLSYLDALSITSLYHKPKEVSTKACQLLMKKIKGLPASSESLDWNVLIQESTSSSL